MNNKNQSAEDFIGWKSEDGNLEVVRIDRRNKFKVAIYRVTCKVCSKDKELFPLDYFTATKGNLLQGKLPCGCAKHPAWNREQYLIKSKRAGKDKNTVVHGFAEEFHGRNTKLDCECKIDGHRWKPSINDFINSSRGCPRCGKVYKQTPKEAFDKCEEYCTEKGYKFVGFPEGYKNVKSVLKYECPIHGIQTSTYNQLIHRKEKRGCPSCSDFGYNPDKQGTFYIVHWYTDDHEFVKFGITNRSVETRIKEQADKTEYKYKIVSYKTWEDGHIALNIEKSIKRCTLFEKGVVDSSSFKHGFTETVDIKDIDKLLEYINLQ